MSRLGLGLAALGRPAYINLGRATDLPDRSYTALRDQTHSMLDYAYRRGVRHFDVARSYGDAERFLAEWLEKRQVTDVAVGSKWGYSYVGDWRMDAEVHEQKEHNLARFRHQREMTQRLLGPWLSYYLIHSLTVDSPALTDEALLAALADLRETGVAVGISTSGPQQAEALAKSMAVTVNGAPLFSVVEGTYNVLETSAAEQLQAAHAAGWQVIAKETMANGRLSDKPHPVQTAHVAAEHGVPPAAVALAAVAELPWVDVVLSGAVTREQLDSNVTAMTLKLTDTDRELLRADVEPSEEYWQTRRNLAWS